MDLASGIIANATAEVFSTMLGTELTPGDAFKDSEPFFESEVTALIGLAGNVAGYISFHCDKPQALTFTARLLGVEPEEIEGLDDVRDAVGEIINMIAGSVKSAMSQSVTVEIALPTVIMTPKPDMRVKGCDGVVVPFEDPSGLFHVELVVAESKAPTLHTD